MKIVVDTNIIFSAILNTNGKIGDLLLNSDDVFQFYSPDYGTGFRQPVDAAKLSTFCGSKYNPNSPANLKRNNEDNQQALHGLNISPNPFSNQFTPNFTIEEETKKIVEE